MGLQLAGRVYEACVGEPRESVRSRYFGALVCFLFFYTIAHGGVQISMRYGPGNRPAHFCHRDVTHAFDPTRKARPKAAVLLILSYY